MLILHLAINLPFTILTLEKEDFDHPGGSSSCLLLLIGLLVRRGGGGGAAFLLRTGDPGRLPPCAIELT